MLVWAIGFAGQLASLLRESRAFVERDAFSPFTLIFGNCSILIVMYYLIELVRPGWLTFRRGILMALPFGVVIGIYYGIIAFLDEPITRLASIGELPANLGQFNVWFRFVIFFFVLVYLVGINGIAFHFMGEYRRWTDNNFASTSQMDITWLYYLAAGQGLATVSFVVGILIMGRPVNFVIHQLIFELFFSFLLYKGLFHQNPYPEGYFRHTLNEPLPQPTDDSFESKFPEYLSSVRQWMEKEKPYLNSDFKLMDVTHIVPLNRSYLSRIFNMGFGQSFNQVVQQYRIEEAKRLLLHNPRLVSKELFPLCGFTSEGVFHRTFTLVTGMTPKRYRSVLISKHEAVTPTNKTPVK